MLPIKKVITPKQAFEVMKKYNKDHDKEVPNIRYVYNYAEWYEGILSYKNANDKWCIYEDLWEHYLNNGFPDLAIKKPVMKLAVALRYLHSCGIDPNYKLREFRKDADAMAGITIIKEKKDGITKKWRISRTDCNKFLAEWNGNR
jgi:hypothetical protein